MSVSTFQWVQLLLSLSYMADRSSESLTEDMQEANNNKVSVGREKHFTVIMLLISPYSTGSQMGFAGLRVIQSISPNYPSHQRDRRSYQQPD